MRVLPHDDRDVRVIMHYDTPLNGIYHAELGHHPGVPLPLVLTSPSRQGNHEMLEAGWCSINSILEDAVPSI
jgi:hypothetical protein